MSKTPAKNLNKPIKNSSHRVWQYLEMDWGEWVPKLKDNVLLVITSIGIAAIIGILYYYGLLSGVWASVLTVTEVGLHFIWYAWGKTREKGKYFTTRLDKIAYAAIAIAVCFATFIVLNVFYDVGFLAYFSSDWQIQLFWMMGLTYICWLVIGLMLLYKHQVQPSKSVWFAQDAMISYLILPAIAILFAALFIYFGNVLTAADWFWIISIAGGSCFAIFAAYLWMVRRKMVQPDEFKHNKSAFWLYTIYYVIAVGIVGCILYFTPIGAIQASLSQVPIVPGQATPTNYFSYIFYIFFQSPIASIMIAIMTFGMIVNIFASVLGGLGRGAVVIGVIITVVPPMVIVMEIFAGGIPAPDLLNTILGTGVASFIFALCETGVFIIVAIILSVFSGIAELLAPKMPAVMR